jgi:peptide/nickel transport system permease protein
MKNQYHSYWSIVWKQYTRHRLGVIALFIVMIFCVIGIYAPLLASSKPLMVEFEGNFYFPLFRYLFFTGFYTKYLDIFYNLLMFTFPFFVIILFVWRHAPRKRLLGIIVLSFLQCTLFLYLIFRPQLDPASNGGLNDQEQKELQQYLKDRQLNPLTTPPLINNWKKELLFLTPYAKLNLVLQYQQRKLMDIRLQKYQKAYIKAAVEKGKKDTSIPTLWHFDRLREQTETEQQQQIILNLQKDYQANKLQLNQIIEKCDSTNLAIPCEEVERLPPEIKKQFIQLKSQIDSYEKAKAKIDYTKEKKSWLERQTMELKYEVMPLIRPYHWEDDAGGEQDLNQYIGWWDLTRINRKDMVAALIFGIRISLSVGLLSIGLALLIGIPLGAIAGYYGGKVDMILYRLIEIWESMPTFFMLLMVVAFLQSKSIFLVIGVIGLFGWTSFSRFIRGEFFKQKQLPYVEACHALGFSNGRIMFNHLLPNAIPPLLTLVPFAIMSAITSEAGLSFLGLGEEGSSSWGVLMDEGRSAFPSESYLLWPPAILLTLFLVAIAIVGDALRDALDPKMHY